MLETAVRRLREEAARANQRRLLVLAGADPTPTDALEEVLDVVADDGVVLVGGDEFGDAHVPHQGIDRRTTAELLGQTHSCVVLDCRRDCRPNTLGRVAGVVDGGGLLVLLTPPLDEWPDRPDGFDDALAVPPFDRRDVTGRFRERLVTLLRGHPGVAIVDTETGTLERDGLTHPDDTSSTGSPDASRVSFGRPHDGSFPTVAYERCLTGDQRRAVHAMERVLQGDVVVVEADRGRGKSSAAGLVAGSLAADGRDVLVTAPDAAGTVELFARAREVLGDLDLLASDTEHDLQSATGGRVRFAPPARAADLPEAPDVVLVDEAAGLPVALLGQFLGRVATVYTTTVHGYEGAGRGFSVRFRERLADHDVTDVLMRTPIRYAVGDPVETFSFRALALDARPAVAPAVEDATVGTVEYERPTADELLADEHRLRELFGLLVLAHYRTEPDDLGRLLDAPNLLTRVLTHEGRVVSVALLAREGGLPTETCEAAYLGGRVRGNMLPDLLTGQLRDPDAGRPRGIRTVRIATHPAVQERGLGSHLLDRIHEEFDDVDWFGVGYGATPRLLRFWADNGYDVVHLSTTRNETSGEHSAAMLRPAPWSDDGVTLHARHTRRFRERVGGVLSDTLRTLDPDVVRAALAATGGHEPPVLTAHEWRVVASMAFGPGQMDMFPDAFRRVAVAALTDGQGSLDRGTGRLLVRRVLQGWSWERVADDLDYPTASAARKALGRAYRPLVEQYGTDAARDERARYDE